jgi:hypothetical protein
VSGADDQELAAAVALARHVGAYHDAVDAFFEECRARASDGDDEGDEPLAAARRHADESLARTRRAAEGEGIPYDHLFER